MHLIAPGDYAKALYDHKCGLGTDKAVSEAVMKSVNQLIQPAAHVPTGPDQKPHSVDHQAETQSALRDVERLYQDQAPGSISLTLLGEAHDNQDDRKRALEFIRVIQAGTLTPSLVIFERGMKYPSPDTCPVVNEAHLTRVAGGDFGMGLRAKQRSQVVAGYLAACIAGGSQNDTDKAFLFYGANHADICAPSFDYFSRHTAASYLEKRDRTFFVVRSHV